MTSHCICIESMNMWSLEGDKTKILITKGKNTKWHEINMYSRIEIRSQNRMKQEMNEILKYQMQSNAQKRNGMKIYNTR